MHNLHSKKGWRRVFLILLVVIAGASADLDNVEEKKGAIAGLLDQYEQLPKAAKLGTTALAGFVTSRVALKVGHLLHLLDVLAINRNSEILFLSDTNESN